MENITLGQIALGVAFLVGLVAGVKSLKKSLKEWISDLLKEQFESLSEKIEDIDTKLDKVDMESCKDFLVGYISDFDDGDKISETELERFWERYEHYLNNGGNSYIKSKVEKLKQEGKL